MNDYTEKLLSWLQTVGSLLPWVAIVVGSLFVVALLTVLILRILDIRRLLKQKYVFLELTPPASTTKTPEATQRLFTVLHGLHASRTLQSKLRRQKVVFSLELPSVRENGIRYIMRVPRKQVGFFEHSFATYLSSVQTRRIDDYLPAGLNHKNARVLEFKQTGHLAYPLQIQSSIYTTDLVGYLTGMMTKLKQGELIAFQLTVSPAKIRQAERIGKRLMNNEELLEQLGKRRLPGLHTVFNAINTVLFGLIDAVGDIFHGSSKLAYGDQQRQLRYQQDVAAKLKPARILTSFEQDLAESVNDKVRQPLYRVSIRAIIVMQDENAKTERVEGVKSALSVFGIPGYQELKARWNFPNIIKGRYRMFLFKRRLPSLLSAKSCILSASEIGAMYHFPTSAVNKTENVATSLSKVLPATIDLKRYADAGDLDVLLGRNAYHGTVTDIGLTADERQRHVYIIGGTGNGKTTMLEYAITQDIKNGKGVALVDPHGDLARKLLRYIPEERVKDVVYLNPVDIKHPIGLNLLELPEGLDDELAIEKERVTEAVISVLRKVFADDAASAHRIESILRNTIHTAMTVENATLFSILKLLRNKKYRSGVIGKLKDEDLKDFWREELGKAGGMQLVSMTKGVTTRIDRFRSSEPAKRMLGQEKSTINFEDIMNSGKILICNFAQGEIGEDTSALFGTTVLAKLKMAAERRAKMLEAERKPFYLYVDEFQEFATAPFIKMLSGSRKYKLFLTMAQQSTTQQEDARMSESILNNVGTVVCFRTGSSLDIRCLLPRFKPYLEEQEIINLPSYNFYIKLSGVKPQEPVSGETILPDSVGSEETAGQAIDASRANYAKQYEQLKAESKRTKPQRATPSKTVQGFLPRRNKQAGRIDKGKRSNNAD